MQEAHPEFDGLGSAELEHLQAGIPKDVVRLFSQVAGQRIVREQRRPHPYRGLAHGGARVVDQMLDGGPAVSLR